MDNAKNQPSPPIYIVSGGAGASGEQVVHTVLVQFPESDVQVITAAHVRQPEQVEEIMTQAAATDGLVVHTLIDAELRRGLIKLAQQQHVTAIDLMGDLLNCLAERLGQAPVEKPGLYRQLNLDYFERVSAIEFTMAHDDGKNRHEWNQAEIVLVGVSRVGKTPLSMYLAVLGWKVANYPLVIDLPLPPELRQIDPHRVVGLVIEPGQLIMHREQRQRRLGAPGRSTYTEPLKIYEEVETARKIFKKFGFSTIDITDKPMEASADEIIRLITRQAKGKQKRTTQPKA